MTNLKKPLPQLESLKNVHIVGVCGTLMGAFAAFLKRGGIKVTGSDQNVYPPMSEVLQQAGVQLYSGYRRENLSAQEVKPDLVVIGNVISISNPEAQEALSGDYAYCSLPEAMEQLLLKKTRNLVVSGTHGKTTTSSMLAFVLSQCGGDPSYFIGGVARDLPYSFHVSSTESGRYFVLEGDEYDTAFWDKVPKFNHYLSDDVILTSVEYDHADIYPSFESVIQAFQGLVDRIRPGGRLIACMDYPVMKRVVERSQVPLITYGSHAVTQARFISGKIRNEGEWTRFEVMESGHAIAEISLWVPGKHNVLNALSVWIECRELGIPSDAICSALAQFRGVKRRQEVRGEVRGVMVMDDFAHHPTAVRETLQALRLRYPDRRLIAIFEPRSATSRRKVFQKDYAKAFNDADAVFIATPYDQTRIAQDDQFSSEQLVEDLVRVGKQALLMKTVDEGVIQVAEFVRSGDLVAVLSNGGFGGFIGKLLSRLPTVRCDEV